MCNKLDLNELTVQKFSKSRFKIHNAVFCHWKIRRGIQRAQDRRHCGVNSSDNVKNMNIQQNKKQNKKSAAGTSYSNKKQRIETKCSVRDRSSCSISRNEAVH